MAGPTVTVSVLADSKRLKKTFDKIGGATSGLNRAMKAVGRTAAAGIAIAAAALAGFLAFSFKSLANIEKLNAQTKAVLKSTRGASSKTFDQLVRQAEALEKVTGIEREAVQAGQNMLLTFTNIKGTRFDQATKSALDMSVALGVSMPNAAKLVGKALNDPIKGVGALTKAGVQFTDKQKAVIKRLVETGDVAGAQGIILQELNTQFGGSAEAFGNTFLGALEKVKNSFGNLGETVVDKFVEPSRLGLLKINDFLTELNEHPAFQALADKSAKAFEGFVKDAPSVDDVFAKLGEIGDAFQPLIEASKILGPAIVEIIQAIGPDLSSAVQELLPSIIDLLVALLPLIPPIVRLATSLVPLLVDALELLMPVIEWLISFTSGFVEAIDGLVQFFKGDLGTQEFVDKMTAIQGPFGDILDLAKDLGEKLGFYIGMAILHFKAFARDAGANVTRVVAFFQGIPGKVSAAITAFVGRIQTGVARVAGFFTSLPGKIVSALSNVASRMLTVGKNIIDGLINGIKNNIGNAISAVTGGVTKIIDGAKSVLGIKSPSRVFKKIGQYTIDGLAIGLSGVKKISSAMSKVTKAVVSGYDPRRPGPRFSPTPAFSSVYGGEGDTRGRQITVNLSALNANHETGRMIVEAIDEYDRLNGKR